MHHERIHLYPNREDVTLTTYVLDDSKELLNGASRPGIVVCPGGGYLGCSDREGEAVALRFAAMGYHAFVLRYSTHGGDPFSLGPEETLAANPRSVHPAPVRDIGKAILTIRERATGWLVDTDRLAICGFSAGGHNCAMFAVSWNRPVLTEHFGVDAAMLRPAAAIIGYGLSDYHIMRGGFGDPLAKRISDAATVAFFGTPSPTAEQLDEASPALHVTTSTPPVFVWATAADSLVPVTNSTRLANALAEAGVPFEAHIFEEGVHGLSLADQSSAGSRLQIDPDAAAWVSLAERWLGKRFALSLPDLPEWARAESDLNDAAEKATEELR